MFSKESLETLKQRIDIVEVISAHIDVKRAGAAYKALCPFHDEKTPSFVVQKGDSHYHCFGCGAHGDAIQFLMAHLKMSFLDAVESLAQRFHVHLERIESHEKKGPSKTLLKDALANASHFFQFMLLHTPEGHQALKYLYSRGLNLEFIQQFQLGFAPAAPGMLRRVLHEKSIKDEIMLAAGLIQARESGGYRDFFSDRITFPFAMLLEELLVFLHANSRKRLMVANTSTPLRLRCLRNREFFLAYTIADDALQRSRKRLL